MPPAGFEPTISAGERPQTYALDRGATTTGRYLYIIYNNINVDQFNQLKVLILRTALRSDICVRVCIWPSIELS
jgi:hypothetical protein